MKPEMKDDMEDKMKSKLKERIGGMLRNQWYLMIHSGGFWLAFLLMLGFTLGGFLHNVKNSWGENTQELWTAINMTALGGGRADDFVCLLALVVSLSFAASYIADRHYRVTDCILSRTDRRIYLEAKFIICFIGSFLIAAVPLLADALLCAVTFPNNDNYMFGAAGTADYAVYLSGASQTYASVSPAMGLVKLFLFSPWLYYLVYVLLFSVFSGMLGILVLAVSCWLPLHKVLLLFPAGLLIFLTRAADERLFFEAAHRPETVYINLSVADYFIPFSRSGQNVWVILGAIVCLFLFCWISMRHVWKTERI